jgi:hypothetical protein
LTFIAEENGRVSLGKWQGRPTQRARATAC